MQFKSTLLLTSAIALGLTCLPLSPAKAQSPTNGASERNELGFDFKLNAQQRRAIEAVGEFAIDQMEAVLSTGLDPKKVDRVEVERRTKSIQQILSTFRLDDQQKATLRTVLQTARQQMKRQIDLEK